jgi:hypothetical protein
VKNVIEVCTCVLLDLSVLVITSVGEEPTARSANNSQKKCVCEWELCLLSVSKGREQRFALRQQNFINLKFLRPKNWVSYYMILK